ncbi:MAG: metallophosphoesterase [Deltaproteobacteria bacterium]|nr:metallophosphoesterase [Deltaproteobacteria bacterium]
MSARAPALRPGLLRSLGLALVLTTTGVACGSEDGTNGGSPPIDGPGSSSGPASQPTPPGPTVEQLLSEKPWEVVSKKGETLLPNVFYADASQNEQIMPYAIDGHVMIDRLVYPTLGNPNLYTKNDPQDELVSVLRIEDEAYAHLGLKEEPVPGSSLSRLPIVNDAKTGFTFLLVPRESRPNNTEATTAISSGNGTGVIRIYPSFAYVNPIPADMPAALKKRKTVRFVFDQRAMAKVPAGLYDLRFEVRNDNELYKPAGNTVGIYEYQYNAVRVFDTEPEEHKVINVTDTQVSVGDLYDSKTKDKLSEFVQYLNTTNDPNVRQASFITFNGDLHNGGSPGSLRQRPVAWTYANEAKAIVDVLKYLPVPIFLTAGNHDGYVSTGHVPGAVKTLDSTLFDSLEGVSAEIAPKDRPWPDFAWTAFERYLQDTEKKDALGGLHRDIFVGSFARSPKDTFADGWKELPRSDRNYILYDGFYQWQKTYGPLYMSWKFGKNFYVSLNSFELRQHRRSGWGMYTVNYGGGMSDVQMAWLDRELLRTKVSGDEVILLAHHDPRGGHQSKDPGYYFEQLEYRSVYQSAINYLVGKVWNSAVCKLPDWALSRDQNESCVHDGLQEWMRPDPELDCAWGDRSGDTCKPGAPQWFSGIELMTRVAKNPQVRTMLLGHTHYNQLEVLQGGDEFLPGKLAIDGAATAAKFATLEVQNPIRAFSFQKSKLAVAEYDEHSLPMAPIADRNALFAEQISKILPNVPRTLDGPGSGIPRELMILRLVSNADLANQTYAGASALGFGVLHFTKKADARAYPNAQINRMTFFVNKGSNVFTNVKTVDLDRTKRIKPHDPESPIQATFQW